MRNVVIIRLPETYKFDHFTLTVIEKSDDVEIQRQTKRLDRAGDSLQAATLSATPPEQKTETK